MTDTPGETRGATPRENTRITDARLRRVRWMVRAILLAALLVSAWANALAAQDNAISRALHVAPVAALWCAVEIISRVPATSRRRRNLRNAATGAIGALGAWSSYWHMTTVARKYGEHGHGSQYLLAIVVDGLVVVASVSLVELALRMRSEQTAHADAESAARAAQENADLRARLAGAHGAQERAEADARTARESAARWENAARDAQSRLDSAESKARRTTKRADAEAKRAVRNEEAYARVRAEFSAGTKLSDILIGLEPDARPGLRTAQEWVQDLREVHRTARAGSADSA